MEESGAEKNSALARQWHFSLMRDRRWSCDICGHGGMKLNLFQFARHRNCCRSDELIAKLPRRHGKRYVCLQHKRHSGPSGFAEIKELAVHLRDAGVELYSDYAELRVESADLLNKEFRFSFEPISSGKVAFRRAASHKKNADPPAEHEQQQDEDEQFETASDGSVSETLLRLIESPDSYKKALLKTFIAGVYCAVAQMISAFVVVVVHDRVPNQETYKPLPDMVLDNLPHIPWAFGACELLIVALGAGLALLITFHKNRIIVMRRMFSLVGTVFLLRCVTILITSLSVPGRHIECLKKVGPRDLWAQLKDAYAIWSNMGLSLKGVRTCGDYMFSGHTTTATLLSHFIAEYAPPSWHFCRTLTWITNLFCMFFILAAHEHYSIDVFIAFYISSRLFLYYHVMANNRSSQRNSRTKFCFPLLWLVKWIGYCSCN